MDQSEIIIDQRPIWKVLLERSYRILILALLALSFWIYLEQEPFEGLSVEAYRTIGAFILCIILWVTQLLPLAITGLLAIAIIPLLGVMPSREAFSYFGNEAVFFILGAFILSAALLKTGLSTRMAMLLLNKSSTSPKKLVWKIMFSCFLLSCLMPEHAVAAFFLPIIIEMTRALKYTPSGGSYGRNLFMAMAWGCIIGGIVTLLGGARAPLALGILQEMTGTSLSFYEWMTYSIPLAIPMLFIGYFVLIKIFPIDVDSVDDITKALEVRRKKLGLTSFNEKWVAVILGLAIFSWIFLGGKIGLANIAIASAVLLFVVKAVSWKDMEDYVNWGIILMYGGAICLGRAMESSGAVYWLADLVLHYPKDISEFFSSSLMINLSPAVILFIFISLITLVFSELVSNAAVVAILMPVCIGLADSYQIDPRMMSLIVALPAGLASILPISTPAMALAYSSGYLSIKDCVKSGLIMNAIAWLVLVLLIIFVWPLMGGL
jgi:sodium-dependent dicarboxylate transporter 2/3/5